MAESFPSAPENPYAAPQVSSREIVTAAIADQLPLATQWQRLVNFVVDAVAVRILSYGAGFGLGFLLVLVSPWVLEDETLLVALSWVTWLSVFALYYLVLESTWGRTLGKLITGTKVVRSDGTWPGAGRVLLRTLVRLVPFEPLSFLGARQPAGWHDRWSGTRVIQLWGRKFSPEEPFTGRSID